MSIGHQVPVVLTKQIAVGSISQSYSLVKGAGNNRLVEIHIGYFAANRNTDTANRVTSVTFNGVACTLQTDPYSAPVDGIGAAIYTIDEANLPATAGSYTIAITAGDTTTSILFAVVKEKYTVDQTALTSSNRATDITAGTAYALTPATVGDEISGCLIVGIDASGGDAVSTTDTSDGTDSYSHGTPAYSSNFISAYSVDGVLNFAAASTPVEAAAAAISLKAASTATYSITGNISYGLTVAASTLTYATYNHSIIANITITVTFTAAAMTFNNAVTIGGSVKIAQNGSDYDDNELINSLNAIGLTPAKFKELLINGSVADESLIGLLIDVKAINPSVDKIVFNGTLPDETLIRILNKLS